MFERTLVLSPHTDDMELGCGGTLARGIREGKEAEFVVFISLGRLDEQKKSLSSLGGRIENFRFYDYDAQHRNLATVRQAILQDLIRLGQEFNPTVVLTPTLAEDSHQDHQVITGEALRAFKDVSVLGYEMPTNILAAGGRFFVRLAHEDVERKVEALGKYETLKAKNYMQPDFIHSLARVRGLQAGCEYAEMFECLRWFQ